MTAPLAARWTGEAFDVLPRHRTVCDADLVVGQVYEVQINEDRSAASHRHFFSAIRECWLSLSEDDAGRFQSPETLRKYALIKAGYADSHSIVASSRAEAKRIAAFVRPTDEFSIVTVDACTVTRYTAKSQSMRSMGKVDFNASKSAVLEVLADLLGTSRGEIENHVRAA